MYRPTDNNDSQADAIICAREDKHPHSYYVIDGARGYWSPEYCWKLISVHS